jgi:hypothetical protein
VLEGGRSGGDCIGIGPSQLQLQCSLVERMGWMDGCEFELRDSVNIAVGLQYLCNYSFRWSIFKHCASILYEPGSEAFVKV